MSSATDVRADKILILGAGELGQAVLNGFLAQRDTEHPAVRLSVLLRPRPDADPESARRLEQYGASNVDVVTADFQAQSESELAAIFQAYDAVVNCSGYVGGMGTQLKITRAVLQAGVPRYFPWQFGVDYDRIGKGSGQPVWDEQLEVRSLLRQQKRTQWLIVSTGMFTSFLFEPFFGVIDFERATVNALGDADFALTLTTANDIGRLTARIFFHRPQLVDEVVFVAGDTLSYRQLTDVLSGLFGRPFELVVKPRAQLEADSLASPTDLAAAYRFAFAIPHGVAWDKSQTFNAQQSIPVQDVKDWLRQHKLE